MAMRTFEPNIGLLDWSGRFTHEYFAQDPLLVAPALLGSVLVHIDEEGIKRCGIIVETEAYRGEEDQACHARVGRTKRTETMYGPPGYAYVYLIYGMYHMFNVVTWPEGRPSAVLVRALLPLEGNDGHTNGPGKLCRALHITRKHNGIDLQGSTLYVVPGTSPPESMIATAPRVGIDYAGEWAKRPWRFAIAGNPNISKPRL
jgi:DNA-3-methyladenine glycosylase